MRGCALLMSCVAGCSLSFPDFSSRWPPVDGGGAGAVALVQLAGGGHYPDAGVSVAFDAGNVEGNTIIVYAYWHAPATPATVSDSRGNTYLSTPRIESSPDASSLSSAQIFYAENVRGGVNTVSVTVPAGNGFNVGLIAFEYSGLARSDVLDTAAGIGAPTNTAAASSPSITVGPGGRLLIGAICDITNAGIIDAGVGWTSLYANFNYFHVVEHQVVDGGGSYAATGQLPASTRDWIAVIAAFKAGP